ncbi:hypothetical protein FBULB1_13275 [Fusarium bulbicola]|nr:hypothetical protein FBULB1_13275 [Fusarium bulbicola]
MEAVGAGASILTFITVAFSVTQSIHSALSAIKDGPQVIRLLTDEISQLKSILQRLNEVSFVSINDIDKSQLNSLAKKCKDDLSVLNSRLKSLDVANSDGRGDRLWRKLKLSFSEKDLDQVRHVVRGHVQHLTVRLNLIQVQQGSFTATQSTQILDLLQQLKQDISALQTSNTATLITEEDSSTTSARVTEVDDEEMDCSPDTSMDDSINRLMRLLEKKPCVVESDDSEELLQDIEHLLECVRNDAEPVRLDGTCQNCHPDISKELKLMANIILSSPSMMINQTATKFWGPVGERLLISQEPKRKAFETEDGVVIVTTAKRRGKSSSGGENERAKNEPRRDFLAKLTYTSKKNKEDAQRGLDIDEVAYRPDQSQWITPSHLALMEGVPAGHYEALLRAGADVTLEVEGEATSAQWTVMADTEARFIVFKRTLDLSPFVYANSNVWENQDLIQRVCLNAFIRYESEPNQALQQVRLLVEKGYDVKRTLNDETCLHLLLLKSHIWLERIPEYMDLLSYLIEHGADLHAEDHSGYQPWCYAYGAICEACHLFGHSARGDVWDAVLTYLGYDIWGKRKHCPRKARYITGYTRGDFEKLWNKQRDKCPYWDDRPWPPASEQTDTVPSFWSLTRGNVCEMCEPCVDDPHCFNCGVCLSSFEFFCDNPSHAHDKTCPRERVATWESEEDGWKYVKFSDGESGYYVSSSEDSDDGGILLQGRLEE